MNSFLYDKKPRLPYKVIPMTVLIGVWVLGIILIVPAVWFDRAIKADGYVDSLVCGLWLAFTLYTIRELKFKPKSFLLLIPLPLFLYDLNVYLFLLQFFFEKYGILLQ